MLPSMSAIMDGFRHWRVVSPNQARMISSGDLKPVEHLIKTVNLDINMS